MTDNTPQRKPATDEERQKSLERWHAHIRKDGENPHGKETFDELTKRAAQPAKPEPGKSADPDNHTEK